MVKNRSRGLWSILASLSTLFYGGQAQTASLPANQINTLEPVAANSDTGPMLFLDMSSSLASEYLMAAHRSHSSHRSHRSHSSSRGGGGYHRTYTPPPVRPPAVPSPSLPRTSGGDSSMGLYGQGAVQQHDAAMVKKIQKGLKKLKYDPGSADGVMGEKTKQAIRLFQAENGLAITGVPSQSLLDQIIEAILNQ